MIERRGITLFQIFFLSFSYVFSGLFLIRETAFLSLLVPLAFVLLYGILGYLFLRLSPVCREARWLSFLSGGSPHLLGRAFAVFLSLLGAAELVFSWLAFAASVCSFSEFISFSLAAATVLFLAIFVGAHGVTVIGRFTELFSFLILPLVFWLVFFDFTPVDLSAFSENMYTAFVVSPAPILYLFSMTALQSTATPNTPDKPILIPVFCFLGAMVAVLCAFLLILYGADKNNIFLLLFGWMTALARLSLLICVCTADRAGRTGCVVCGKTKKQA